MGGMSDVRYAVPIRTFPPHADPVQTYLLGRADEALERDEREIREYGELLGWHMRELDRLLARVDAVEPHPHWVPRESDDLAALAQAVGLLEREAA